MWINPLYLPEHPHARAKQLVERNPFATVISKEPVLVAHMPFLWRRNQAGAEVLVGHMPLVDPIAHPIARGGDLILVFHGPAAYITPHWYDGPGLPTYNYSTVHVHGATVRLSEPELVAHLHELVEAEERLHRVDGRESWSVQGENESRMESLVPRVLGFEVALTDVQVKDKLGQNRGHDENAAVADGLEKRGDSDARGVAAAMRESVLSDREGTR